jgi:magnesium and cobalt exporter, CNNM family
MAELFGVLALLVGNALFVAGEFALIASRRTVVEPLAARSTRARAALRAMDQIPLMIAGAQLGITVCSLGLGAIAEPALAAPLARLFAWAHVPGSAAHPVAFVLALALVVSMHTVVGEMVPKNLTLAGPERAVIWLGGPMLTFCTLTKPVLLAMRWASRSALRIWGIVAADTVKTVFTAEELAALVTQARAEGLLDLQEHARISGALALHHRTAVDAMRPWSQVTTVTEGVTPSMIERLAIRTGRSRFPVVARAGGRVLGFVHVKDSLWVAGPARFAPVPASAIRPLVAVPPDRTLAELLLGMRRERRHIALVGQGRGPLGIVTLQDVLSLVAPSAAAPRVIGS